MQQGISYAELGAGAARSCADVICPAAPSSLPTPQTIYLSTALRQSLKLNHRRGLGGLEPAGVCRSLLESAGVCWGLLGPAGACCGLLEPPGACWSLLGPAGACWGLLEFAGACWSLLESAAACWSHARAMLEPNVT